MYRELVRLQIDVGLDDPAHFFLLLRNLLFGIDHGEAIVLGELLVDIEDFTLEDAEALVGIEASAHVEPRLEVAQFGAPT